MTSSPLMERRANTNFGILCTTKQACRVRMPAARPCKGLSANEALSIALPANGNRMNRSSNPPSKTQHPNDSLHHPPHQRTNKATHSAGSQTGPTRKTSQRFAKQGSRNDANAGDDNFVIRLHHGLKCSFRQKLDRFCQSPAVVFSD